jgi:hypothetical protein
MMTMDKNRPTRWLACFLVGWSVIGWTPNLIFAGGGPENLILAVNLNSPASLAVANLYIELRGIPATNVVYLDLPFAADQEQITLAEFREKILKPIIDHITIHRLDAQIDYIVYSADFPTSISIKELVDQLIQDVPGLSDTQIKLMRPVASINAMTFFAGSVLANDNSFLRLDANWYMRQPIDEALRSPFVGDDDRNFRSAQVLIHSEEYEKALGFLEPLAQSDPLQFATHLLMIRCQAGLGRAAETAESIRNVARCGWGHRATIAAFPEFTNVAADPLVTQALESIPNESPEYLSSHAFRRLYAWGVNGGRLSRPEIGRSYLLSTVLAVTRNNGTSLDEALEYLRTAVAADYTQPEGSFYFALTGDVRTTSRQPGFESAIAGLRELGFEARIIKEAVPSKQDRVAGAMLGDKVVRWPASLSKLLPGAIVDNMTSLGGRMKGDHHTPATEFLKWGAAGSSGTVIEPFSVQAKFAHPMIMVHYARGCSLAEAYYQSVHCPFQLLIVGDALCQPWAKPVPIEAVGLGAGAKVRGLTQVEIKSQDASRIEHFELYLDGVKSGTTPKTGRFSFDADQISDGYHELRIVAVASGPLETRSRVIIPFFVDQKGGSVQLIANATTISRSGEVLITAESAGAVGEISVRQNDRTVAKISESGKSVRVAASTLGVGTSRLMGSATIGGQRVQSEPITVTVE